MVSEIIGWEAEMLIVNLKALMTRKSAIEGKKITYSMIEDKTGIKAMTLSRIASNPNYNFNRKDLEKLIIYFGCEPDDILTVIREEKKAH